MADRIEASADLAVNELRRKARRRLVGAVVLALAAAILLPLLLEQEPRPLGDDVSIQIPPVDNGKFVSRLSPAKVKDAKSEAKAAAKSDAAPAPVTPPAPIRAAPDAPATRPITPAPKTVSNLGAKVEPAPQVAPAAASQPASPVAPAAPAPAAPIDGAAPADATAQLPPVANGTATPVDAAPAAALSATLKAEGFIVQLAAFTDDKGANSLVNKVKKLGYPAYTVPVKTSRGTLWRVRVGSYPTRAEANEALAKLKAEGHNGLVSAAK